MALGGIIHHASGAPNGRDTMYPHSSRLGSLPASDQESPRATDVRTGLANTPDTSMTLCSGSASSAWSNAGSSGYTWMNFSGGRPKAWTDAALATPVDWRPARPIQNI